MKISEYADLADVKRTRTGLYNEPPEDVITKLQAVCVNVYDKLCDHFAIRLYISSGYRSPSVNQRVGGAKNSQHIRGEALDIDGDENGISNIRIFEYIKNNLDYDQLIMENGWVHVSYKATGNRKQIVVL